MHDYEETLTEAIDRRLRETRPDRYASGDMQWMARLAKEPQLQAMLDDAEARHMLLIDKIKQRETQATRRGNRTIRDYGRDGQLALLDWFTYCHEPVAIVEDYTIDDGKTRQRHYRVAMRAITPKDLRLFASNEKERAEHDMSARMATVRSALDMADAMEADGADNMTEWRATWA